MITQTTELFLKPNMQNYTLFWLWPVLAYLDANFAYFQPAVASKWTPA